MCCFLLFSWSVPSLRSGEVGSHKSRREEERKGKEKWGNTNKQLL